jgi:uridine kinase
LGFSVYLSAAAAAFASLPHSLLAFIRALFSLPHLLSPAPPQVVGLIPDVAILHMDNYNVPDRLIDGNFDDPRLTDYELLLDNVRGLKEGRQVETPIYDFKTSSRVGYKPVSVPRSRIVIVEGIYALSDRLRPFLDLRVSITGGVHFDLVKRVLRDVNRSGQAPEEIIQQIADTVYPMYKAYIEPDLATAHLRIYNNFNPFSGFMEPTFILKSARGVPERDVLALYEELHQEDLEAAASSIASGLPPTPNPGPGRSASGRVSEK